MTECTTCWFTSDKAKEAIEAARSSDKALLIFIKDTGYENFEFEEILNSAKVKEVLEQHYVGLELLRGTFIEEQFEQLVPVSDFPSLFAFYDGKLIQTIKSIRESDEQLASRLSSHLSSENDAARNKSLGTSLTLQEKEAMLKARLDEKRKAKEEEKKKEQKAQEVSRRQQARELSNAKLALQERESKNLAASLAKEKKEAKEHLLRVREGIARDRAERQALKQAEESIQSPSHSSQQNPPMSNATKCRLNLRLSTDGSSYREEFEADEPLSAVREHVAKKILPSGEPFELVQTFPRRNFSASDELLSLRELYLCPSNTLLIKIPSNSGSSYSSAGAGVVDTISSWVGWGTSTIGSMFSSQASSSTSSGGNGNRVTTLSQTSNGPTSNIMSLGCNSCPQ